MVKKIILTCLISITMAFASELPDFANAGVKGMDSVALKALIVKKPSELEPEMAIVIGNIYEKGMPSLNIIPNKTKAAKYYKSGADRGIAMGNLLLANLAMGNHDVKTYTQEMKKVMQAHDAKLSIPAGLQLAGYWASIGNTAESVRTLLYLSSVYDEPRAQFMAGWAIATQEYIPYGMTVQDGLQLLNTACNNPLRTEEIEMQCKLRVRNIKQ